MWNIPHGLNAWPMIHQKEWQPGHSTGHTQFYIASFRSQVMCVCVCGGGGGGGGGEV